jgi:hypothetical protein
MPAAPTAAGRLGEAVQVTAGMLVGGCDTTDLTEFPSPIHERAAFAVSEVLIGLAAVDAVSVVGSCARRADANDLDLSVLVTDAAQVAAVEQAFASFAARSPEVAALASLGPFVELDLHVITGQFAPGARGWTTGPDALELEIGNEVAHARLLWQRADRFDVLRQRWLPYYDEALRATRLAEARMYAINDLEHVPVMLRRDEPFHAFHRLYLAFHGFLQALFIARRHYPIAYDKWVKEQVEGMLSLPELYAQLPSIIGIDRLDQPRIAQSCGDLRSLLDKWAPAEPGMQS